MSRVSADVVVYLVAAAVLRVLLLLEHVLFAEFGLVLGDAGGRRWADASRRVS